MNDTNNEELRKLVERLPIVHQFGCPALERSDGGLQDYSCRCGNERRAMRLITSRDQQIALAAQIRSQLDEANRYLAQIKTFVGQYRQGDQPNPENLLAKQSVRVRKITRKLATLKAQEKS